MTSQAEDPTQGRLVLALAEGRRLFGQDPAAYLRSRPAYPSQVYDEVFAYIPRPRPVVVEVGPGPGLATREVLHRGVERLIAVEPDPRLAAALRRDFEGQPVTIVEAPFETAALPEAAADLCFAATSFHWVEPRAGHAQVRRVLRSDGVFVCLWTIFEVSADPFLAATRNLSWGKLPTFSTESATKQLPHALDTEARRRAIEAGGLELFDVKDIMFEEVYDPERLTELYASFSIIRAAAPDLRDKILTDVHDLAAGPFGGEVRRQFQVRIYFARPI